MLQIGSRVEKIKINILLKNSVIGGEVSRGPQNEDRRRIRSLRLRRGDWSRVSGSALRQSRRCLSVCATFSAGEDTVRCTLFRVCCTTLCTFQWIFNYRLTKKLIQQGFQQKARIVKFNTMLVQRSRIVTFHTILEHRATIEKFNTIA